ncbi:NfeD family protein [Qipengyuania sp. DSG2-2]|uniref:NfeD family protein n=1 Tax=Qipengyuania sp. DGS2-2 TaxID=3349631 RepID=UPI0036D39B6A
MLDGIEPHWIWVALGLILAAAEMLVPGVFLIWLAMAALATGLLTFMFDLGPVMQVVQFVTVALITVFSAKRILRDRPIVSSDPLLNNRMGRLVGETATVTVAISHGSGRIHVGDSDWSARGPDLSVGERVRITGNDGSVLLVEPLQAAQQVIEG